MDDGRAAKAEDGRDEADREVDVLVARLIDGQATPDDRDRFEEVAAAEPAVWRTLALRQQDASGLADEVREATDAIEAIELPRRWLVPAGLTWTLAISGWAALLILAVWWGAVGVGGNGVDGPRYTPAPATAGPRMTPEEHYRRYLAAPYVLGDMEPQVLELEQLSDGRIAVHFVRRIEEVAFLAADSELPVDESGQLTKDPDELRRMAPVVRWGR